MSSHSERFHIRDLIRSADATALAALANPAERDRFLQSHGYDLNRLTAEERQEVEAEIAEMSGQGSLPTA